MKKNYILDTNVLIRDPDCLYKFEDNNVIIPLVCIEELDKLKQKDDLTGYNAKQVGRELYKLTQDTDITKGVILPSGGMIKIETNHLKGELPDAFDDKKADNKLLVITKNITKDNPDIETILVTQDIYLTVKAKAIGIKVQDYSNDKIKSDKIYSGYEKISLSNNQIKKLHTNKNGVSPDEFNIDTTDWHPNMFLLIENLSDLSHTSLFKYDGKLIKPLEYDKAQAFGATPRNLEQKMAFELLMDESIPLVTISGAAGTGKTFLSMAVVLEKVLEQKKYNKIILIRPVTPAGDDIGFLPGTEEEKLKPWMGSFYDAVESLMHIKNNKGKSTSGMPEKYNPEASRSKVEDLFSLMQGKGIIETKTFTYMRGRNINALVIIDEAQEMTPHLAKLMITRAGEDARFIMIGDPSDNQIDNTLVNSKTNGFVYVIEQMKSSVAAGHVSFEKVERSFLAKEAERLL